MDLKHLDDHELLTRTEDAAQKEREATTQLLWHLWEVQRRRLFAKAGTSSLFDYCVRALKMSEPQAARRVNAARALADIPEIEEKINSGALTLTTASQAQSFFNREARADRAKSLSEKKEILKKLENCSARKADQILLSHTPDPGSHRPEKYREVSESLTEVRLTLDPDTMANLERLKEIWSHSMPAANLADVIKKMAEMVRDQVDPVRKAKRQEGKKSVKRRPPTPAPESTPKIKTHQPLRGSIAAATSHQVWLKEGGRCTFKDPSSGRVCGSRHRLQMDHIRPIALGGENTLENLRLRCFHHNQWHALQTFGRERVGHGRPYKSHPPTNQRVAQI